MKKVLGAIIILLIACLSFVFVGCEPSGSDKVTLKFETNGGESVASVSVDKGGIVDKPIDPVRENYYLCGWYVDAELTEKYDFSTALTQNATVYAKWNRLDFGLELEDGEYIVGEYYGNDSHVVVPAYYNGIPVTQMYAYAYMNYSVAFNSRGFVSVELPDTISQLPDYAFYGCQNLEEIEIPSSITEIKSEAFGYCHRLTRIVIPSTVTTMGSNVFNESNKVVVYCEAESKPEGWSDDWNSFGVPVVWGSKANTVDADGYKRVSVDGINYALKDNAASVVGTKESGNLTIPSSVTYEESTYLVKQISEYAFSYNHKLESVVIPSSVTSIGKCAFYECVNLQKIEIPSSVSVIDTNALGWCRKATIYCEVTNKPSGWADDWKEDADWVVWNCKNNDIDTEGYKIINLNGVYYGLKNNEAKLVSANPSGNYVIPSAITYEDKEYPVTELGYYSLSYSQELLTAEIPASIKTLENSIFMRCYNLTSVDIKSNLEALSWYMFSSCESLTSINIPSTVLTIAPYTFYCCSSLTSIVIPSSVTLVEQYAFYDCHKLVIYSEHTSKPKNWNTYWNSTSCPVVWDYKNNSTAFGGRTFVEVDGVKYQIMENSWSGNTASITGSTVSGEFTIPTTITYQGVEYRVTSIGQYALASCKNLTKLIIPSTITYVEPYAFRNCFDTTIYCEAESKPDSWSSDWNFNYLPVVWGYQG